jgi:RNA polymerase subunit RPABC4/transcription elongation factor Spt4
MRCPVCHSSAQHPEIRSHSVDFDEEIVGCDVCGSSWSLSHGMAAIVTDTQERSFLSAVSEIVEGGDYAMY